MAASRGCPVRQVGWIRRGVGLIGTLLSLAAGETWGEFHRGAGAAVRRETVSERDAHYVP
ncbi:MAG: hypothetical protein ACT4OX_09535 [Actinomycetota bacterium]